MTPDASERDTSVADSGDPHDAGMDASIDASVADASCADLGRQYACRCDPRPATAPATVMRGGTIWSSDGSTRVIGAQVTARVLESDAALASTTTDSMGRFSLAVPTGGIAQLVDIEVTAPGYSGVVLCGPGALTYDETFLSIALPPLVDTNYSIDAMYTTAGIAREVVEGTLEITSELCVGPADGHPVVSTEPPADQRFAVSGAHGYEWHIEPVGEHNTIVAFNVAEGVVALHAELGGARFRPAFCRVRAGDWYSTMTLQP